MKAVPDKRERTELAMAVDALLRGEDFCHTIIIIGLVLIVLSSFNKECVKLGTAETGVRINTSFSKPQKSPTALHGEFSGHMFVTLLTYTVLGKFLSVYLEKKKYQ